MNRSPRPRRFHAIPGTTPRPRALFLDRWGTLLELPPGGYARDPDEVRFFPGALEALFKASRAGWKIYLLGNEEAVARGELAEEAWREVEARILDDLSRAGVLVTRHYVALDHPEGVGAHQGDSVYLLPNTGAFYHAAHTDGIDLAKSWVIGDSTLELVAGWRAGCRQAAVRTGLALTDATFDVDPDLVGADLVEIVLELLDRAASLSA